MVIAAIVAFVHPSPRETEIKLAAFSLIVRHFNKTRIPCFLSESSCCYYFSSQKERESTSLAVQRIFDQRFSLKRKKETICAKCCKMEKGLFLLLFLQIIQKSKCYCTKKIYLLKMMQHISKLRRRTFSLSNLQKSIFFQVVHRSPLPFFLQFHA